MLPFLRLVGDGREHSLSKVTDVLADQLNLSAEDRRGNASQWGDKPGFATGWAG